MRFKEILITNAYVIPDENWLRQISEQGQDGVRVRMLTNSLASHDVPAVNSHYRAGRKRLLQAGLELHELRHDAALQPRLADTAPNQEEFVGQHVKAALVGRGRVFIGSMNLDPRPRNINSEMGVVIESTLAGRRVGRGDGARHGSGKCLACSAKSRRRHPLGGAGQNADKAARA